MKKLASFFIVAFLVSCAHFVHLLPYERKPGSSPLDEWGFHDARSEWWYVSGFLADAEDHPYFFHYTLFHGSRLKLLGYNTQLAVADLESGLYWFEENNHVPSGKCSHDLSMIACPGLSFFLSDSTALLNSRGDSVQMELSFRFIKPVTWHGDRGVITMGDTLDPGQQSYYYSYSATEVAGKLTLPVRFSSHARAPMEVKGHAWIDKQWGHFKPCAWTWFSIRLDDGSQAMVFYFPETGHQECTFIPVTGEPYRIQEPVIQYTVPHGEMVGPGSAWQLTFRELGASLTVEPLLSLPFHSTRLGVEYWEGPCRVLDQDNNKIGVCVVELTR